MGLNVVALLGRLVAEPELRHTPSGVATCTFRIAVDRSYSKDGERKADFIDIVTWRQIAEFVCKYFHKGSMIAVNGSIQTRNYEDKNGNKRTAFEVVAGGVHFAGGKDDGAQRGTPQTGAQRTPEPFKTNAAAADVQQDDFAVIDDSEDLPF
jgi:single-strand DNA-binding protein|nr:MAG TPA: Single strand binding protein [Caudoviricetes sp.]